MIQDENNSSSAEEKDLLNALDRSLKTETNDRFKIPVWVIIVAVFLIPFTSLVASAQNAASFFIMAAISVIASLAIVSIWMSTDLLFALVKNKGLEINKIDKQMEILRATESTRQTHTSFNPAPQNSEEDDIFDSLFKDFNPDLESFVAENDEPVNPDKIAEFYKKSSPFNKALPSEEGSKNLPKTDRKPKGWFKRRKK